MVEVDGAPYDPPSHMFYKSYMLSDVPNFAFTFGYESARCSAKHRVLDDTDGWGGWENVPESRSSR